nr:nuclear pore complex protein Nup85-like isoform X2 [Ciona intestinalis]|eukprot:XP_002128240.1 nuclear pore complex protein Nup85-like isoform X2 [Ciona intestinalis]
MFNNDDDLSEQDRLTEMFVDVSHVGCCLMAKWRTGCQLMVYPAAIDGVTDTVQGGESNGGPIYLHDVKWNLDMHTPVSRKLVNESYLVFASMQEQKAMQEDKTINRAQLLKFSRNYRSIIRSCLLELQTSSEDIDADVAIHKESQMQLYSIMDLVWSLCEIIFIENLPGGVILLRMVEWCKWNFPLVDDLVRSCMSSRDNLPYQHPEYWNAVTALVLQGRLTEARDLLKLHPEFQVQVYDSYSCMDELLRKMPVFSYHQGQSISEFEIKWQHWQAECVKRLKDGDFDTKPELKTICRILTGDNEVLTEVSHLCGNWYQMLVTYLLYNNPTTKVYDLYYHSQVCIQMCNSHSEWGALDNILLAVCAFDIDRVIRECCEHLSNWWLPAHLSDLLNASGLVPADAEKNQVEIELQEILIVRFAESLMSLESYWNVVAGYLANCGPLSQQYLALFVQRITLTSEKKASKVLRLCEKHNLNDEAQSICRQLCRQALREKRHGDALSWCIKLKDSSLAMYIADEMLSIYAKTGVFPNIDLIDYLGSSVLVSERLTFLGKYRDFHKLHANKEYKEAGYLLLNLLISKIAPLEFWPSLIMDCLLLLSKEDLIYGVEETTNLLSCLNTLDQKKKVLEKFSETEKNNHLKRMQHLRVALTNNLAKAIVS